MNQSFYVLTSPKFVTGRGSISFIKTLGKKRIGIIRGGKSYNDSIKSTIETIAQESSAEIRYLTQIRNEPYIEDIFKCMEEVRSFEPDMILAIGGGSVLDTAKAIHLFYENPEMTFEQSLIPFSLPALGKKAVHVSVPTTSGTGSEATSAAVFIDPETKIKKLLLDNGLVPHYAILDADTTDSLTQSITVATGMDALTHAIEASVALNSSALSRALALQAATDILENLEASACDGELTLEKKEAREKLHIASALAGVAITNSCTGIAHSYDHPGPAFGLPHGTVCGLMLPYTMEFCGVQPAYVSLSKRLGYKGDDKQLTKALINHLFALMDRLNMKTSFKLYGIDEAEYMEKIDDWATNPLNAFATMVSPSNMTVEKGIQLFKNCYYGTHSML